MADFIIQSFDAFGRLRTSGIGRRLDVEFIYDKQTQQFDEITNGGSATVTHNTATRDLTLAVGSTTNGHSAAMSSYPVPYTPGDSQLIHMTGVLDLANIGGGTAEVFLRSSISGSAADLTTVAQSSWTLNTSADWSKSHIFQLDFQSLKVGTIRAAIVADGVPTQVAQIDNDDARDSGYWQLANLPITYRVYNTATETISEIAYGDSNNAIGFRYKFGSLQSTATMKAICATVKSEGGVDVENVPGIPFAADNGTTTVTASTTLVPILSIRVAATYQSLTNLTLVVPKQFQIETDESIRWAVINNATLTNASFGAVDSTSGVEYDVAATAVSGGTTVRSGYIYATSSGGKATGSQSAQSLLGKLLLWARNATAAADTGILTIAAIRNGSNDAAVLASIGWEEIR